MKPFVPSPDTTKRLAIRNALSIVTRMEGSKVTATSEVRKRLDDAGLQNATPNVISDPISEIALKRGRFVQIAFWLLLIASFLSCVFLFVEAQEVWPSGTLASSFAGLALFVKWRWAASQYKLTKDEHSKVPESPENGIAKGVAAEIITGRREMLDGSHKPVPKIIGKNRYFALLLQDDPRLHALVLLPWGVSVKGPFYFQANAHQTLLDIQEAPTVSQLKGRNDPQSSPEIQASNASFQVEQPCVEKVSEPAAAVLGASSPTAKISDKARPAPPRKSSAKKREFLSLLPQDLVVGALEGFFEDAAIDQINHEMYSTATLSIWQSFSENLSDDYIVMNAIDEAKAKLCEKFHRIALTFPRDTTGDLGSNEDHDTADGQRDEANSDAWIRAIAYGTNKKLRARLEQASAQPRLAL